MLNIWSTKMILWLKIIFPVLIYFIPDPVAFEDPKDETTEDLLKTTTLEPTTTEHDSAKPNSYSLCSFILFGLCIQQPFLGLVIVK